MADYFKPWQRKIGVLTVMLAFFLAIAWVRSNYFVDSLGIRFPRQLPGEIAFGFQSFRGRLGLQCQGAVSYPCPPGLNSIPITALPTRFLSLQDHMLVVCKFPYWLIVIPLTQLSAWLLLYRPRSKTDTGEVRANSSQIGRVKRLCFEQIKLHLSNIHIAWLSSGRRS